MRKIRSFEAYLDRQDTINIYLSAAHYDGLSSSFWLFTGNDQTIKLDIMNHSVLDDKTHVYECHPELPIVVGTFYEVVDCHGRRCPLRFGQVIKSEEFSQAYTTNRPLGAIVDSKENTTTFNIWAPTSDQVSVFIYNFEGYREAYVLYRNTDGVYSVTIPKNFHGCHYYYLLHNNGKVRQVVDPYGIAQTPNGRFSVVVDKSKLPFTPVQTPLLSKSNGAIIYEVSVRDLTKEHTFKALCTNRIDVLHYIKDLGVTHIQLMPVLEYGSVDEKNVNQWYNWGYDTVSWFSLEGSYSSNVDDPFQVIKDFREFVNTCHSLGLKVVCDVVYNHVFELKESSYYNICPYYCFQIDKNEKVSNSSGCGNDVDSTMPMCRRFILDSVRHLFEFYDIDGLRLDLMGILDCDTVNAIRSVAKEYKVDALVYGEGWNMPSFLPEAKRATINNASLCQGVGFFSDILRDAVKGSQFGDDFTTGFASQNNLFIYKCMNALQGSVLDFGYKKVFSSTEQAINYTECHDNMTVYDQYTRFIDEEEQSTLRRCLLVLAMTILAQGIPFIHSGQEFARTKKGAMNSYDKGDEINAVDWELAKEHAWMIEYVKHLIQIRQSYPHFHLETDIGHHVYFEHVDEKMLMYEISYDNSTLIIYFNPSYRTYHYHFQFPMTQIFDENGCIDHVEHIMETDIPPISCKILKVNHVIE